MAITVLIVDDSKLARIVAGKATASLQPGWRRLEAANAEEAKALLAAGGIDVVLLDYNMPGTDGLALAAELRALYPEMPMAIVTANAQEEVIARARAANAAFVAKPVTEEGLRGFLSGAALRLRMGGQ
ncbi:response regulator [Siccirubricoccus sp. KC 17139]|uniref:Response regulator n=1 Tax=Siccirubricoccus soli TaxID=2899147 RepID=A0ABT1DDE9_9PROT|nr:response regulator [Siccirubricoccus soli]MCO6419968.1 response regulator [Siccirubricoccus soli]MCP2686103.1 response regulator [Siccirubricoccus soli]